MRFDRAHDSTRSQLVRRPSIKSGSFGLHARAVGFTLIELLVAITILGVIAVLGWRGLDSIIRSRVALTAEMEQTRGIQLAFAQIENDCAHLADTTMLAGRESLQAVGSQVLLIRTVFDENQPTRLQVVTYRVNDGVLTRYQSVATRDLSVLDSDWQTAASNPIIAGAITLQTGVSGLSLRTWTNGESGWRIGGTESPTTGIAAQIRLAKRTGLEMSLQLQGRAQAMTKVFLLGAV
ncbi:PulJ/GspJ family protein [Undibacterium sp. SXout7W]|uniref:PulJ/GspJ family protein n=1 Tax=Undibacterium sp. SXout7W TaxID=3413049 RepID=UPI003BF4467D